jgi:hypothetical protein
MYGIKSVMKSFANGSGPAPIPGMPCAAAAGTVPPSAPTGAVDVTGRHHDDHRLRFVCRDQIVEDEAGASDRGPRIIHVARAVKQIENGVALAVHLVSGRRVHMHAPDAAKRRRVVVNGGHGAVRHVLGIEHIRAGNDRKAVDGGVGLAGVRIARVDDRHAIHDEDVAVRAGRHRPERSRPDAIGVFGQLGRSHAAATDARDVAGAPQFDGLRGWGENAEGDAPIGADLRRGDGRSWGWGRRLSRQRCEQTTDDDSGERQAVQHEAFLHHGSLRFPATCGADCNRFQRAFIL